VALVELDPDLLREGVKSVTAEDGLLVLRGSRTVQKVPLDARFTRARAFEGAL
jgi:hypothetical protein